MNEVCWKCREKFFKSGYAEILNWPWTHCHHEPKEKQKCWCEFRKNITIVPHLSDMAGYVQIKFCPECGRKL